MGKISVGILGFGKLGQYLTREILQGELRKTHELAFVWNRTRKKVDAAVSDGIIQASQVLPDLSKLCKKILRHPELELPNLIVEIAHPDITRAYGYSFLTSTSYFVGSPTALADRTTRRDLFRQANDGQPDPYYPTALYIPRGALPGLDDILEMRTLPGIARGRVTMKKAPECIKYSGPLPKGVESLAAIDRETVLYRGPLRQLCEYAPNNVNTMATFALASGLSFDRVRARLVAVPGLEKHVVEVEAFAPRGEDKTGEPYHLKFERHNPAAPGAVTGNLTYHSFVQSLQRARGHLKGVHFC